MIRSFRDSETRKLFNDQFSKKFRAIERVARRKLTMLDEAETLENLRALPGNHLELITRERKGQVSVRINDQFRICFRWHDGDAEDVEITDYR